VILCPVGGGGQLSGIAVAAKAIRPGIQVVGVEPAAADDAARSFKEGRILPAGTPVTIADGLKTSLGERPFAEIQRLVDDIVTVREASIVQAMRLIWEVLKIIVEPSGAVSYAGVVEGSFKSQGKRAGIILSGGNLDLERLPWQ
jgi:threonine dehydratase